MVEAALLVGQEKPTLPLELPPPQHCPDYSAKRFAFEPPGFCCCGGETKMASNAFPSELIRLSTSDDDDSSHFRTYARLYNNLFAFSSLGRNFDAITKKAFTFFNLLDKYIISFWIYYQ